MKFLWLLDTTFLDFHALAPLLAHSLNSRQAEISRLLFDPLLDAILVVIIVLKPTTKQCRLDKNSKH